MLFVGERKYTAIDCRELAILGRPEHPLFVAFRRNVSPGCPDFALCNTQQGYLPGGEGAAASARRSGLAKFSCWCPKVMAAIGRLPDTLADRCIIIRMQRKRADEKCERLRHLETTTLKRQCARFVLDHGAEIASASPVMPESLNDRAEDIWEPLLALADLAGGNWPELARTAAVNLTANAQDNNPIGSLLMDIFILFTLAKEDGEENSKFQNPNFRETSNSKSRNPSSREASSSKFQNPNCEEVRDAENHTSPRPSPQSGEGVGRRGEAARQGRMFSRDLAAGLNRFANRPWAEMLKGKEVTELWVSLQLRPYGIRPRTMRNDGERAKGYFLEDFMEVFRRYIPRSEVEELKER